MSSRPVQLTSLRYPFPGSSPPQAAEVRPEDCRLSLRFSTRVSTSIGVSSLAGLALGLSHGSRNAGLRFRAENAHRLPSNPVGWYAYHKAKNYYVLNAALREGMKMGAKCGFWVGGFFTVEEAVDRARGTEDFVSTVVAGLAVAGVFTVWSMLNRNQELNFDEEGLMRKLDRFPLPVATKTARSGLVFGLAFGLMEDALALGRGQRVAYVDYLLGRSRPTRSTTGVD